MNLLDTTINKAIEKNLKDNNTRYVYPTYTKVVMSFNPEPTGRKCYKITPAGIVYIGKENDWHMITPRFVMA